MPQNRACGAACESWKRREHERNTRDARAAHCKLLIIKDADVARVEHAFGAHTVWMTVSAIMHRYGSAVADPASFVVRGKAGLTILSWLADAHGVINSSTQPLVGLDNPVIAAAVDWLQSSLAIEQSKAGEQAAAARPQPAEGV